MPDSMAIWIVLETHSWENLSRFELCKTNLSDAGLKILLTTLLNECNNIK